MTNPSAQDQVRAVIIDDNLASAKLLHVWLTRLGFGPSALNRDPMITLQDLMLLEQQGQRPRLVIVRAKMQSCSASDVLQTFRKIPTWSNVKIVVLTEEEDLPMQAGLKQLGADGLIPWPLAEFELQQILESLT